MYHILSINLLLAQGCQAHFGYCKLLPWAWWLGTWLSGCTPTLLHCLLCEDQSDSASEAAASPTPHGDPLSCASCSLEAGVVVRQDAEMDMSASLPRVPGSSLGTSASNAAFCTVPGRQRMEAHSSPSGDWSDFRLRPNLDLAVVVMDAGKPAAAGLLCH